MKLKLGSTVFFFLLFSTKAFAFVENITHGYTNCTACHVAPAGGGLLNDYGRSLSRELMSTWGWKGSEEPAFGLIKNTDTLTVGGEFRSIQTYFESPQLRRGQLFIMQDNLEVGYRLGKVQFVGTVGNQGGPSGTPRHGEFLSERHYALWNTAEDSNVRVGKFRIAYGLYDPDHTNVTKSPLGFGPNSETYNLEFSKFSDEGEIFLSSGLGRIDLPRDPTSERNFVATFARYFWGRAKIGSSLLFGESPLVRRGLVGLFGVVPVGEKGIVKFEVDGQKSTPSANPDQSLALFAGTVTTEYEVVKGLKPYLNFQYAQSDLADSKSKKYIPGVGAQWLPLPHLELQAQYQRQTLSSAPGDTNQIAWLLFHFYL